MNCTNHDGDGDEDGLVTFIDARYWNARSFCAHWPFTMLEC